VFTAVNAPGITCDKPSIAKFEVAIGRMHTLSNEQKRQAVKELGEVRRLLAAGQKCDRQLKEIMDRLTFSTPGKKISPN